MKLFAGILGSNQDALSQGINILEETFGKIDLQSETISFNYTTYYNKEMGNNILRKYVSFEKLFYPGKLWEIKTKTNEIELNNASEGKRRINIDPGYVTLSSLVLATTKDASFRVYLNNGIYAQPTLYFKDKTFHPYEWTYPDYRDPRNIRFFVQVRNKYKEQRNTDLKEKEARSSEC